MRGPAARRRNQRGSAVAVAVVFVFVCAALAASSTLVHSGRQRETQGDWDAERAFQLAESGIDWGLAQVRDRRGDVSGLDPETVAVQGTGDFTVVYGEGDANGADDDGDGVTDESDESRFQLVRATGRAGQVARTLVVLLESERVDPSFEAATIINVDAPILDVSGNAFRVSGFEHGIDGALDPTKPAKWAVTSPAPIEVLEAQVADNREDQLAGLGGTPSFGSTPPLDLSALIEAAQNAATITLTPGTHSSESLGTPTLAGVEVVRCDGDLHLSGGTGGAGVLVVDGDLHISGGFEWVGIVLVRGRVQLTGGGSGKRIIGALVVDEEITGHAEGSDVTLTGTVDLLFSSAAIDLAAGALVVPTIIVWREAGNP